MNQNLDIEDVLLPGQKVVTIGQAKAEVMIDGSAYLDSYSTILNEGLEFVYRGVQFDSHQFSPLGSGHKDYTEKYQNVRSLGVLIDKDQWQNLKLISVIR